MQQIQEKPAYATVYEWIGGEAAVKQLVERFYDLMDLEPGYTALRALHQADLQHSRDTLFWFLCGWMGGPQYYQERFGHPRLRMRHLHVPIGIAERDAWVACMDQAMRECGLDAKLQAHLHASFLHTADFMRNQGMAH